MYNVLQVYRISCDPIFITGPLKIILKISKITIENMYIALVFNFKLFFERERVQSGLIMYTHVSMLIREGLLY